MTSIIKYDVCRSWYLNLGCTVVWLNVICEEWVSCGEDSRVTIIWYIDDKKPAS